MCVHARAHVRACGRWGRWGGEQIDKQSEKERDRQTERERREKVCVCFACARVCACMCTEGMREQLYVHMYACY